MPFSLTRDQVRRKKKKKWELFWYALWERQAGCSPCPASRREEQVSSEAQELPQARDSRGTGARWPTASFLNQHPMQTGQVWEPPHPPRPLLLLVPRRPALHQPALPGGPHSQVQALHKGKEKRTPPKHLMVAIMQKSHWWLSDQATRQRHISRFQWTVGGFSWAEMVNISLRDIL